jgi:hypothetical protein
MGFSKKYYQDERVEINAIGCVSSMDAAFKPTWMVLRRTANSVNLYEIHPNQLLKMLSIFTKPISTNYLSKN